jgi:tetratricopeptide (TPR) repeat protein
MVMQFPARQPVARTMDRVSLRGSDGPTRMAAAMPRVMAQRGRAIWFASALLIQLGGFAGLAVAGDSLTRQEAAADHAIAAETRAIESGLLKGPRLARFYAFRGARLMQKGDLDRAIQDLGQAISLDPGNADWFIGRASAYVGESDYDRAIQDYDRAIALDPQGDFPRSIAWGSEHVQHVRVNLKYWAFLGRCQSYRSKGEYDRAIEDCEQAVKLGPDLSFAYLIRSSAYQGKGEFDRAIKDDDRVIKLDPAAGLNNRCYHRAITGATFEALDDCNAALQLRPDDAKILDSRGFTYLKLGEIDPAIADYDAALRLAPKMAYSLFGRGMAKRMKGDRVGGDADIAAAKAINPNVAEEMARYGVQMVDRQPARAN